MDDTHTHKHRDPPCPRCGSRMFRTTVHGIRFPEWECRKCGMSIPADED